MVVTGRNTHSVLHVIAGTLALALEHLDGQTVVVGGAVTQLAVGIAAPCVDCAVAAEGHGVVGAAGNGNNAAQIVRVGRALSLEDLGRNGVAGGQAVAAAQLSKLVVTKGPDLATQAGGAGPGGVGGLGGLGQDQGEVIAGSHSHGILIVQVDLGGVGAPVVGPGHVTGHAGAGIAQLAQAIVAGGVDLAIIGQHNQMGTASRDGHHMGQVPALTVGVGHLDLGGYGAADGGTIAQLTLVVKAPGPHGAIGAEGGGEAVALDQCGHSNAHRLVTIHVTLGDGHVDGAGVGRNGIGEADYGRAGIPGRDGGYSAADRDGGHRAVGGDPLDLVGGSHVGVTDRQSPAVHQQVEGGQVGLQQVVPRGGVGDGQGITGVVTLGTLHGDIHGGKQCLVAHAGSIQSVDPLLSSDTVGNYGLVDHQGLGLHVAHLNGLGGDLVHRDRVSTHDAHTRAAGSGNIVAPGVYEAVGPDHDHPVGASLQGQNTLEVGAGVGVEGLALQHRSGSIDRGKASLYIMIDVPIVGADAQLALASHTPGISIAALGHGDGVAVAHPDRADGHISPLVVLDGLLGRNRVGGGGPLVNLTAAVHGGEAGTAVDVHDIDQIGPLDQSVCRVALALVHLTGGGEQQVAAIGGDGHLADSAGTELGGQNIGVGHRIDAHSSVAQQDHIVVAVSGSHDGIADQQHVVEVVAQALDTGTVELSVAAQDQGEIISGIDLGNVGGGIGHLVGILIGSIVANTQLTLGVVAPNPQLAVLAQGQGMPVAHGHHGIDGDHVILHKGDPDLAGSHHHTIDPVIQGDNGSTSLILAGRVNAVTGTTVSAHHTDGFVTAGHADA